jgi:uncharacterized protein (DUF1015 family)
VGVPRFEPFRALRYRPDLDLAEVTAPPYDVLSVDDTDALRSRHPDNIVHVDVPDEADGETRYARAATTLEGWVDSGVMRLDGQPSFTLYRMEFAPAGEPTRRTVGVIGAMEVVDEGGEVIAHERTTPKASTDRLDLTRATSANLSPVWALSLTGGLSELLAAPGEPLGAATVDGVTHILELVDDPRRVTAISSAVGESTALIADGHHRYGVSRIYRDEQRAALRSAAAGDAELTMTYVAELVEDQLTIDAIHRLYHGVAAPTLETALAACFEVAEAGPVDATFPPRLVERGALCLIRPDGTGAWLTPRPEAFVGVRDLDGEYLEHAVAALEPEVTYQHGVAEVLGELRAGRANAAVLIRPTSITEIRRTADERLLMPPKSTFFTPKLRTGTVIRPMRRV